MYDSKDVGELLISKGVDINEENKNGECPLIIAYNNMNINLIRYLIERGANVDIKIQTLFESHIIGEIDEHSYNEKLAQLSDLSNKLESEINIYNSNNSNHNICSSWNK